MFSCSEGKPLRKHLSASSRHTNLKELRRFPVQMSCLGSPSYHLRDPPIFGLLQLGNKNMFFGEIVACLVPRNAGMG